MSEPSWLFRVASERQWGGGHVARCRALAEVMRAYRPVAFMLDEDDGGWSGALTAAGFVVLPNGDVPSGPWCGSLIDGYGFGPEIGSRLAQVASPLVAIDDLLSPPREAALVVNPGTDDAHYEVPSLLGSRFALIHSRFRDLPAPAVAGQVERVLVSFGRYDTHDAAGLVLSALSLLRRREAFAPELSVVLGGASPNLAAIRTRLEDWDGKARLIVDSDDMPSLIRSADLVLGAGGVSLYERMACGVPSVTLVLADNQAANVDLSARHGATVNAGTIGSVSIERLAESIFMLARSRQARMRQSQCGQAWADGHGPSRVAEAMMRLVDAGAEQRSAAGQ